MTVRPAFFNSHLSRSVTNGTQPPQPVPTLEHRLSASNVSAPPVIAARMAPFDTLLQEHTWAESGIASTPITALFPVLGATSNSCGRHGSGASVLVNIDS